MLDSIFAGLALIASLIATGLGIARHRERRRAEAAEARAWAAEARAMVERQVRKNRDAAHAATNRVIQLREESLSTGRRNQLE